MAVTRAAVASAALALVGVAGLSGCTSDAQPSPMPTPAPSASTSPTPSPTPPSLPAEASGTSPAAAKAFVRHYFEVINYSARTGDTDELRSLGTDACESCDAIASNIERIYGSGGHIKSANWRLDVVTQVPQRPSMKPAFDLGVQQAPESVVPSAGASVEAYPGGKKPMTIYLVHEGTGWAVGRLDEVPS